MDEARENLRDRRDIVSAYLSAARQPAALLQVCARVAGDSDDAISAIAEAFEVGNLAAQAILEMRVRQFTPSEIKKTEDELAAIERDLADS